MTRPTRLLIFVGSGLGGVLRYLCGGAVQRLSVGTFPIGPLTINIVGCLCIWKGFIVASGFTSDALTEIRQFFKRVGKVIVAISVREILDEEIAQRLV
ncbi:MAG: CrcB family protein [Planctomycetota bacterium]